MNVETTEDVKKAVIALLEPLTADQRSLVIRRVVKNLAIALNHIPGQKSIEPIDRTTAMVLTLRAQEIAGNPL